jgi:hypothetical protein
MADSNQVDITIAAESTFGTSPGEAGTWGTLRTLSDSLKHTNDVTRSDEIRSLRDTRDLHWINKSAGGSINMNGYYDDNYAGSAHMQQWALGASAWSNSSADLSVAAAAAVSITATSRTFALDASTWANDPAVGDWVYISGAANAASNGYHKVESIATSNTFTVETDIGADESSVSLTIVVMSSITNGETLTTLSIQRNYTDLSSQSELFVGMAIDGWSFGSEGQETMKQNFDFLGFGATSNTSPISADVLPSATDAYVSPKNCDWIREGSNYAGVTALGVSFQVQNNIRKRYAQGTFGASAFKQGDFIVSGNLKAYFATETLFDKFINQADSKLAFAVRDQATTKGNANIYDWPNVRYTDGRRVAGGRNQDIIADLSWEARYHSGTAATMKIAKTASA